MLDNQLSLRDWQWRTSVTCSDNILKKCRWTMSTIFADNHSLSPATVTSLVEVYVGIKDRTTAAAIPTHAPTRRQIPSAMNVLNRQWMGQSNATRCTYVGPTERIFGEERFELWAANLLPSAIYIRRSKSCPINRKQHKNQAQLWWHFDCSNPKEKRKRAVVAMTIRGTIRSLEERSHIASH